MKLMLFAVIAATLVLGADAGRWSSSMAHAGWRQGKSGVINLRELSLRRAATVSPMPEYPRPSLERKASGVAVAALSIGLDGRPEKAEILEAPDSETAAAVQAAVMRWVVPWQSGPAGEPVRRRTGKLTFYFRIVDGRGRVFNPEDMPGGPRPPAPSGSAAARGAPGSPPPSSTPGTAAATSSKTIVVADMEKLPAGVRPVVLDIGVREAFKREHWPGAVNIPVDELSVRAGIELAGARAVAIDCTRDEMWRCQAAAAMLAQHGVTNVAVMIR